MMTCCCLVCTLILWPRSFGPHCSPWWIADEMKCCSRLRDALRMNCETPLTESWGRWLTITCSTDVFATFGQQEQFVMHNTNICHHLLRWHAVSAQLLILHHPSEVVFVAVCWVSVQCSLCFDSDFDPVHSGCCCSGFSNLCCCCWSSGCQCYCCTLTIAPLLASRGIQR